MTTTSSTVCSTSESTWLETSTVRPSDGGAAQEVAQPADALRVQAVGGLVEDEDLGVAEQRGGEAQALAHPGRVAARAPIGRVAHLDEVQHLVDARRRQPGEVGERAQVVAPRAPRMHPADLEVGADRVRRRREAR